MTWPWTVLLIVVAVLVYAAFDTWYKQPFIRERVGDMTVTARGDKAVQHVIDEANKEESRWTAEDSSPH